MAFKKIFFILFAQKGIRFSDFVVEFFYNSIFKQQGEMLWQKK